MNHEKYIDFKLMQMMEVYDKEAGKLSPLYQLFPRRHQPISVDDAQVIFSKKV